MPMRKYYSLFVTLLLSLYGISQVNDDPACIEKCSRATLAGGPEQRINYYQYPSMNKYDVKYLKLNLNAEPNSRVISGTAQTIVNAVMPMDSFITELRNNMIVDSVFINGIKLPFGRANDHLFVPLSPVIPAGATVNALVYYHGTASSSGVFAGTQTSSGLVYTATLSESYQAREWFPAKQILSDKIDSADIWITTDVANKAGSNGVLVGIVPQPNNKNQYRWKTRYKMSYYMPMFSVANYMEYLNYAKPLAIAPDSILIQHYIVNNPTYFTTNKPQLDKTPTFIEKMSELYSLYPFRNEKYGHAHAGIGGGMEHQTMSTVTSFGTTLISHELAHQWFGDNVTCATWNHIWLNEGFATYSEYLMIEKLPALHTTTPAAYMQSVHTDVMSSNTGSVFVPDASIYDENRIFNFRLSYEKGAAIIHTLRFEMQDDTLFFRTLRNYQQTFKDSVATANDFRLIAEATSGKNLLDFFNQWYYGEGYPTFNVDYSKQADSIVLFINQTVSAPLVTPFFKGLYEFTINTAQGDTLVKVNMTANNQTFKFQSNRVPTGVVVDPNNWVLNKVGSITTGINDPVNVSGHVRLFPNPSPGTIYLQYPANWFDNLRIYDISGKLVQEKTINRVSTEQTLNTFLQPGTYIIQLNGKDRVAIKKVIIAH